MKKTLKMMSFFAIAFCTLWIGTGVASAATFKIDVINGQDGTGNDYGTITTTKNSCTVSGDSSLITIASGQEVFVEVDEGCTQSFKINVTKEGYEIESILKNRQYIAIPADGVVTFDNITADSALCVKYKKIGAPNSPNTGDVAYVLPVAAAALISLGLIIVITRKRKNVKA